MQIGNVFLFVFRHSNNGMDRADPDLPSGRKEGFL